MKEDVIIRLNSEKLQLEKEVAGLKEQLSKEAAKRVKPGKQSVENKEKTRILLNILTLILTRKAWIIYQRSCWVWNLSSVCPSLPAASAADAHERRGE